MKNDPSDGVDFAKHNAGVKADSLRAFQQRYRARRVWRTGGVLVGLAACFIAFQATNREAELSRAVVQSPPSPPSPIEQSRPAAPASLTDEQLIALFPPGSCWIAEVDGRKTLIFPDEALHRRFVGN